MCGIGGYYGHGPGLNESLLGDFHTCQRHRGPDGCGVYTSGPCGFSHQRLSIIDIHHGDQPMTDSTGRYTIVYNGETYNYLDLRAELEAAGFQFQTECDTEVVLNGFISQGQHFFDRMNGMWALAIWDSKDQVLTLCRDHFGIKPLYLAQTEDGGYLFSSELTPILRSGLVTRIPDDVAIYRYLNFRVHDEGRRTFFQGIEAVLPGEAVTISAAGLSRGFYTRLREELSELAGQRQPYNRQALREYQERFTEAIKIRLQSEVPVGSALSGGLDSSAVVVTINHLLQRKEQISTASVGKKQNTFSAVFPGSANDEQEYVDAVMRKCGDSITSHRIEPNPDQFLQDLTDFIRTQEEPTVSTGPYAQYCVMREATKHVKVLLDGQGADEMMAGYIPYYFVYLRQLLNEKHWWKLLTEVTASADVLFRLVRFRIKSKLTMKPGVNLDSLLDSDFQSVHCGEVFDKITNDLKARLLQDIFENSLPALLRYEDRNTMRFSLEGRVPFLDKELLKFQFSLADESIIFRGWNKRILRDAVRPILPAEVANRRNKIGFTTPEDEWFIHNKNALAAIFSSESFGKRPYFNQAQVVETFDRWLNNRVSAPSMLFWRLANVELWLREFIDAEEIGLPGEEPFVDRSDFGASLPAPEKHPLEANPGRQLDIVTEDGVTHRRYPVQTDKFLAETPMRSVADFVAGFFADLQSQGDADDWRATAGKTWTVSVSESIIAVMQGRSFLAKDIKCGLWAKLLSKAVTRTPAGIGIGDSVTMQLAIQEVGLPKILVASMAGAVGKVLGRRGWFYRVTGPAVSAIDGPTPYSVYPKNISAKLPPVDCDNVSAFLAEEIRKVVPEEFRDTFAGVIIMDANDLGQKVLGQSAPRPASFYESQFADNPLGQSREQTPVAVVFENITE